MAHIVEAEFVQYKQEKLQLTANDFVQYCAKYSKIPETETWYDAIPDISHVIEQEAPTPIVLKGEGIRVVFSGIPDVVTTFMRKDPDRTVEVFSKPNPKFVIQDLSAGCSPSVRDRNGKFLQEVYDMMSFDHKMLVQRYPFTPPTTAVIFPKGIFGEVQHFKGLPIVDANIMQADQQNRQQLNSLLAGVNINF